MRLGRGSATPTISAALLGKIGRHSGRQRWNWPVCMLCHEEDEYGVLQHKEVDRVDLVDESPRHMTVRGHCHGSEDVFKVEFNEDVPLDSGIRRGAWRSISFFNKLITG